jgi:hypothetical protein
MHTDKEAATKNVLLNTIPQELKEFPQWVVWRYESRDGKPKPTKVPYQAAKPDEKASVTDSTTWASFDIASNALASGSYDGIGFVLTLDDPFVGIDLDHCYDPETHKIDHSALAIIEQLHSYTERSPSGTGIRIFVRGALPPGRRKKGTLEFYDDERYLTLTGHHLESTPTTIEDRNNTLQLVHATHFPKASRNGNSNPHSQPITADDKTQLARMFSSKNGAKIKALYDGDFSAYPSRSEADSALCFHLAFWFGRDPERMDRLFRQSKLMREKWDSLRGESTYGGECIANACAETTETYQEADATAALKALSDMNAQYAVVWMGGDCVILREHRAPDTGQLDVSFATKGAVKLFHAADPKIGKMNKVEYWLRHPAHRTYDGLIFQPGRSRCDPRFYNLWRGFREEPKKGDCSLYLTHLKDNIACGNEEFFLYLMAWMANIVQSPGNRPGVAIVLRGKQGTGKGVFAKGFGRLFGPHFAHITNSHQLVGRFNALLKKAVVVFADEAFWAGDKQAEGTLNALITEETHNIEPKGIDPFSVNNFMHLIVASNHEWVIPAASEARRWLVLDVGESHLQDHAYFKAIETQMKNGGSAALLYELLHYDGSGIDLWTVPKTAALCDQKVHSMTPVEKFWFGCLKAGSQIASRWNRYDHYESGDDKWQTVLYASALYDEYVTRAQQAGVNRKAMEMELADALKKMVPKAEHKRISIGGVQARRWRFPSLEECRVAFDEYMNWTYSWPILDDLDDQREKVVSSEEAPNLGVGD